MEHLHTQVRSGMYEGHTSNPRLPVTFRPKETLIGNITPAHWHEHPEILHIIRCTVRIYIQGRVYQAAPGDLVIINPGETHAIPERENGSLYECIIPHRTLCDKMGISFEDHPLPNLIRDEPCEGCFLNMTRCTHARDLLLSGGTCVAECALRCGFQHLSYFTKTYKRYMGELPSQTACAKRLPLS